MSDKRSKWTKDLPPTMMKNFPTTKEILNDVEEHLNFITKCYGSVYLNGQTYGLDGEFHQDIYDDDSESLYTLLYMVNTGDVSNIGNFEYIDPSHEGYIETVEFKPGRIVMFPCQWWHRGLAPTVKNKIRSTLAYKALEVEFL